LYILRDDIAPKPKIPKTRIRFITLRNTIQNVRKIDIVPSTEKFTSPNTDIPEAKAVKMTEVMILLNRSADWSRIFKTIISNMIYVKIRVRYDLIILSTIKKS
jgi:hypothetical protein